MAVLRSHLCGTTKLLRQAWKIDWIVPLLVGKVYSIEHTSCQAQRVVALGRTLNILDQILERNGLDRCPLSLVWHGLTLELEAGERQVHGVQIRDVSVRCLG